MKRNMDCRLERSETETEEIPEATRKLGRFVKRPVKGKSGTSEGTLSREKEEMIWDFSDLEKSVENE